MRPEVGRPAMSGIGAAPCAAVISSARRGEPAQRCEIARARDAGGKARSAQNALKHGFRAQKYLLLPQEDAAELKALETALIEELAPEGVLQSMLAQRVVSATWRLARAERPASGAIAPPRNLAQPSRSTP